MSKVGAGLVFLGCVVAALFCHVTPSARDLEIWFFIGAIISFFAAL